MKARAFALRACPRTGWQTNCGTACGGDAKPKGQRPGPEVGWLPHESAPFGGAA